MVFESDGKAIMTVFLGALICVVLLGSVADSLYPQTHEFSTANLSTTTAAVNATVTLPGRSYTGSPFVSNTSHHDCSAQFTFTNVIDAGDHKITMKTLDTAAANGLASKLVNVTYTGQPDGYISESSSRSTAKLITLFGAIAILIFIIVVLIAQGSLGRLIRR